MADLDVLLAEIPSEEVISVEEPVEEVGLSDEEIRALCEEEYRKAAPSSDTMESWKLALQQYFLEPDGNEEDGMSQVQSSDVRDAVEAAMPILMDMFMGNDSPVVFKPNSEQDIEQAELETVYCQHILNTQNPGLLIIMSWIRDALLLKNGYVKSWWDGAVDEEREDYANIGADELDALLADDEYEVMEVMELPIPVEQMPDGHPSYSVIGKRKRDAGQVRILNIPTDRVRIAAGWNSMSLKGCSYVCHEEECTRSDLIVDGFDPEVVASLPTEDVSSDSTNLDEYRDDRERMGGSASSADASRENLRRFEHYIRADRNGDGITELLKVTIIGETGGTVLEIAEVDDHVITPITPYVIPHSSMGLSLADMVSETQKVQTALLRQILSNVYQTNQPGLGIDASNITNPEALSQPRLGNILLKKNQNPVAEVIAVPFTAEKSLLVMQKVEELAEKKTGLSAESTGLDAEALSKSTNMVGVMTLNQSQLRMRLVMSTLCETGFKPLMLRIRGLAMKNAKREDMVELAGRWVNINPRNWREQRSTQIRIGVGSVLKAERQATLNVIANLQKEIVAQQGGPNGPFVTEQNIYNTLREYEKSTGTMSVDRYFSNPANYKPPAPGPDPVSEALQIEEAKVVAKASKDAADVDLKSRELDIKATEVGIKAQDAATKRLSANAQRLTEVASAVAQPSQ